LEDGALSDLKDKAFAAIASLLEHPLGPRGSDDTATASPPLAPVDADGYTKFGPGPMAAIRFKWSVRRGENDEYFVDEMIGENSTSVALGPMSAEAAIRLVDEREREARARFEQIRREMIARHPSPDSTEVASRDDI
jgi:hypothetical protein